jgi:hypothetical protein
MTLCWSYEGVRLDLRQEGVSTDCWRNEKMREERIKLLNFDHSECLSKQESPVLKEEKLTC